LVGWAETLGGFLPFTAEIVARKRFELRSVIATSKNNGVNRGLSPFLLSDYALTF